MSSPLAVPFVYHSRISFRISEANFTVPHCITRKRHMDRKPSLL
jgi:hypothetical protein